MCPFVSTNNNQTVKSFGHYLFSCFYEMSWKGSVHFHGQSSFDLKNEGCNIISVFRVN